MPSVTIGFIARERFSLAAEALRRIYRHTRLPFRLVVVDCNTPSRYLRQMDAVLSGRENVQVLHVDKFLQPNQARRLVLDHSDDDYVCFLENDVFVTEGWLSALIAACEECSARVAIPLIVEGPAWRQKVHHDMSLGSIRTWREDGEVVRLFEPATEARKQVGMGERQLTDTLETHIMLFERTVFDTVWPFDESLCTREPVDASLSLYEAGIPIVLEPNVRVTFRNPPPVHDDELPFFRFVWDVAQAKENYGYLIDKWNIRDMPGSERFVRGQHYRTRRLSWWAYRTRHRLAAVWRRFQRSVAFRQRG